MDEISARRRFRFRLQSLLLLLAIFAVTLGWVRFARKQKVVQQQLQKQISKQETLLNVYRESTDGAYGSTTPPPQRTSAEDFLSELENAEDPNKAYEVWRMSSSQQSRAVPRLIEMWKNGNDPQRRDALAALGSIGFQHARHGRGLGERAISALAEGTSVDSEEIRWAALSALGQTKVQSPLAIRAVQKALVDDENPKLRIEAAKTLWVLTESQQAVDTIISFLDDPSLDVREYALSAFHEKEISRDAGSRAVPILLNLVTHTDRDIRLGAIFALNRVGPSDKVAEVLLKATKDSDKAVRQQASVLLRQLDSKSRVTP